jgi:hypothetical protein
MEKLTLNWREGAPAKALTNYDELGDALDEVAGKAKSQDQLHLVELRASNGNCLSLVLGGNETVLIFGRPEADPPYWTSRGTCNSIDPVLTCYLLAVHHTEVPRRFVIPSGKGRNAVREFATTGERPNDIEWEET